MALHYKRLTPKDLSQMRDLLLLYGEAFDERDVYQGKPPSDSYLLGLLDNEDFISIVSLNEKKVIAGLSAYVLNKFEQERKEIYIYDLAVDQSMRRKGIATRLIEELKAYAREIGVYVLFVQADRGDQAAVELYKSLGCAEEPIHFDIDPHNRGRLKG